MASKEKKPLVDHKDSAMAELGRRFKANPLIFIGTILILLITIVAFVLVPAFAPDSGSGESALTFGYYDGEPINYVAGNFFATQRDYYNQQFRDSGDDQNIQMAAFQIWRAAFESAVIRTAVLQRMKKDGFLTPEVLVDRRMAEYPLFQEEGRFSAARFRSFSDAERMAIRDTLRGDVAYSRYMNDVLNLRIPEAEKAFMKTMASPERSFEFVMFPMSTYPDSEVSAFVSAQMDLFRNIRLSRITVSSSEADAKKVLASVVAGTLSFEEAAKSHSKDDLADKGGDMGFKYAFELKTEIADDAPRNAILSLAKGSLSEVIKVANGWAFYRCEEAAKTADPSDAALLIRARDYLTRFERGRMEDWLLAKAGTFVETAKTGGFTATAAGAGLEVKKFGPLPLNYGDVEIYRSIQSFNLPELAGASTNTAFWTEAFSTKPGSVTKPVSVGDDILVLNVLEETKPLDEATSIIDFYYPYVISQYADTRVKNYYMSSDKLKDDFYQAFIKYILPQ